MINVLTIAVIHFFSKWRSSRISQLEVFCENVVPEISQNLQQKVCACGVVLQQKICACDSVAGA